jgi:hypothetical protein
MDIAIAASIEATAKEIAAAAGSYQRMPHFRQDLEAGLDVLIGRLNELHAVVIKKRDMGKIVVDYHNGEGGK